MQTIVLEDFKKIDFRVGTVLRVEPFEKARKPAYQVWVDLGPELGIKKSSAQLTVHYQPEDLVGKQVLCVCNLAPRQVVPMVLPCIKEDRSGVQRLSIRCGIRVAQCSILTGHLLSSNQSGTGGEDR